MGKFERQACALLASLDGSGIPRIEANQVQLLSRFGLLSKEFACETVRRVHFPDYEAS
jgi:hypothetical protein